MGQQLPYGQKMRAIFWWEHAVLALEAAAALRLAHGHLYPPWAPDGMINLQDLILLRKMP